MKSSFLVLVAGIAILAFGAWAFLSPKQAEGRYDEFAQCLSEKGMVMYGADWCPHCQNEKKAFDDSFRLINYVECPDDPQLCLGKGIEVYPTWMMQDGRKLVGEQGLKKLSQQSGCPIHQ